MSRPADTTARRPGAARIPDDVVADFRNWLNNNGVVAKVEKMIGTDRSKGGRPATITVEAVLVGLLLAAYYHHSVNTKDITEVLYDQVNPKMRLKLGVQDPGRDGVPALRVHRMWHRIRAVMDPSDTIKNRLEPQPPKHTRSPHELAKAEANLAVIASLIIKTAIDQVPRATFDNWDGSIGLDATALHICSRGKKGTKEVPADPDAGIYNRDRKEEPPFDKKKSKVAFPGYEATLAVMANGNINVPYAHPTLIVGMKLDKPGTATGENGAAVITQVVNLYGRAGALGADRAYNNSIPEKFQDVARSLGYALYFDYRIDQLGVSAQQAGAIQVEGYWYCPSMPETLINATIEFRQGRIGYREWRDRIDQRIVYELRVHDATAGRMACPATGNYPSVGCPIRQGDQAKNAGKILITVIDGPLDRICKNKSVTFDPRIGNRHAQAEPYGSRKQRILYARTRNSVEGKNGVLKDGANAAVADATRRRKRGYANQTLMVAAMIFAANLISLYNWLDDHAAPEDKPDVAPTRRPRRLTIHGQAMRRPRRNREYPPPLVA